MRFRNMSVLSHDINIPVALLPSPVQKACAVGEKHACAILKKTMSLMVQMALLRKLSLKQLTKWTSVLRSVRRWAPGRGVWNLLQWKGGCGVEQCGLLRRIWKPQAGTLFTYETMFLFSTCYWGTLLEKESFPTTNN